MTEALRHRGPDGAGSYAAGAVALGARRLSIIDLPGGSQPMYDETGAVCLVANGEIYNHRELRAELRARGHRFASDCDTEVIVHLYEEYGDRCVEHLRGMFAFAIADGDRLLLARDRYGIKPLYYAARPGSLLFASEIKALLRSPLVKPRLDAQTFADSRLLGYPTGDRTFFEGISSLPPGHTLVLDGGPQDAAPRLAEYYRLAWVPDQDRSFEESCDELLNVLRDAVRCHLIADVEVGLTLSGGLDSAVLALLAEQEAGLPLRMFSITDSPTHPDAVQAAALAKYYGWKHEAVALTFDDYLDALPSYLHALESPSAFGGVPMHVLCRRLGGELRVCLNGEGADEVFGGYAEYLDRGLFRRQIAANVERFNRLGLAPSERTVEAVSALTGGAPAGYLDRIFDVNLRDQVVRHHLEPLDKSAMAAGLEMRVPFMDHRVIEFTATVPAAMKVNQLFGIGKHILKQSVLRGLGAAGPLATSVLRRKIGAPASGSRCQRRFDALCEQTLPADYLDRHELGFCFADKAGLVRFELFSALFLSEDRPGPEDLSVPEFLRERAAGPIPLPL